MHKWKWWSRKKIIEALFLVRYTAIQRPEVTEMSDRNYANLSIICYVYVEIELLVLSL